MQPAEIAKLLTVIAANYPTFTVDEIKHSLWLDMLADVDYPTANMAVRRHIATSRFAPTVAEIREQAMIASGHEEVTATEAWGELMQAVRHHGYYHEREALAEMNPETRRVVERITWREVNMCENLDVLRGQFLRMYETMAGRSRREALCPPAIRVGEIEAPALRMIEGGQV